MKIYCLHPNTYYMSDTVVSHIETNKLYGQLVPLLSGSNKKLYKLPTIIEHHTTLSHLHSKTPKLEERNQKPTLVTLYGRSFKEHKSKYALVFTIPVLQSMVVLENNEKYKNHLYIRLYLEGKYERRELKRYCRVDYVSSVMLALPVFLNTSNQYHILQQIPCIKNFKKYVDEKRLDFIDVYDVKDVKQAIYKLENTKSPSYMEAVKPPSDATSDVQREAGKLIKKLKYHYGPNVDVRLLSRNMTVYDDHIPQYQNTVEALTKTIHSQRTIHKIISEVNLQNYLLDENKCAVVATLHQPEHLYKDAIVAFVLFRFVFPSKDDASKEVSSNAHILLEYLYVCKEYDEYVWDKKKHLETNGIRKQLLREAIDYVSNVLGGYDIFYIGRSSKTRDALQCVGFKSTDTEQHSTKLSGFMTSLSNQYPTLHYRSTKVQCQNWKECLALVKRRHPNMLFKQQLILAKKLLQPNQRTKKPASTKPKQSRRAVGVKEGRALIEEYYSKKYLQPHEISIKSTKQELEDALSDTVKHKAILAYCKSIQTHLKQTKKSVVVLTKEKKKYMEISSCKRRCNLAS